MRSERPAATTERPTRAGGAIVQEVRLLLDAYTGHGLLVAASLNDRQHVVSARTATETLAARWVFPANVHGPLIDVAGDADRGAAPGDRLGSCSVRFGGGVH